MEVTVLNPRRIHRFLALQSNTDSYYRKIAKIVIAEDYKTLFPALTERHANARQAIEDLVFLEAKKVNYSHRIGKSLLGKLWREVRISILVNDSNRLLEYCRQAEVRILRDLHTLITQYKDQTPMVEALQSCEKSVQANIDQIVDLMQQKKYKYVA